MAAIINSTITASGPEIVLNKIGLIIFEELTSQKTKGAFNNDFDVYIERQESFDMSEEVMVNVWLASVNNNYHSQTHNKANTSYFIDIYTRSYHSSTISGSDNSRLLLHKITGIVDYILSCSKYNTLGFDIPSLIGGTYVTSISYDNNTDKMDGAYIRVSRISFDVKMIQTWEQWQGIPLLGNDTTITFDLTNKGFKLIKNN